MPFFRIFSFIVIFIFFILTEAIQANTDSKGQIPDTKMMFCPLPEFEKISLDMPTSTSDIIQISSKKTSIERDQIALFSGDVIMVDKDKKIMADQLSFDRLKRQIEAIGNIHYQGKEINIFAGKLSADGEKRSTQMQLASYQLDGNPGHGKAEILSINDKGILKLTNSTYSTCLQKNPDWQIVASEINLAASGDFGEAYNAQLKVLDVPVFYIPYIYFPISNERLSGFLYPDFTSSQKSGLEISAPFYWNIAENYDATITPRFMSSRGTQIKTEFRYLVGMQSGQLDLEYLDRDDKYINNESRYLARFKHIGSFSNGFRAFVDYTTISDDSYLVDIGSTQYNSNDAYLYQTAELSYFAKQWQTTLKLQDFEVLGNNLSSYKTLPQIEFSAHQPLSFLSSQLSLYSEVSSFKSAELNKAEANRYHIEAAITLPIVRPAWFVNSEFTLMHTHYQQNNLAVDSQLDEKVNRTLPKVRIHGGINFDRELLLFDNTYRHTFEPQLQYLFVTDKDQSNIGFYDTVTLQDDFHGIFRDTSYSGLDRVSGANQFTWGLTSRVLSKENIEIIRLSLGRIQYLGDDNRMLANDSMLADNDELNSKKSSVAADFFYRLNHQWQISADIQYNTIEDFTDKGQVNLDYMINRYNLIQLNHRYTRNVSGDRLEQMSLLSSVAINNNWAFVGRLTRDFQQDRNLESYLGVQYESCCWAIRVAAYREINPNLSTNNSTQNTSDEFDSGINIKLIIKGLDGKQSAIGTQEMFKNSIFGYKQPFYLHN
jgi:LPS-assembly protein